MFRPQELRKLRESVREEFEDKCAYCGSKLGLTDLGAIEHFYPKRSYPEKIYDLENLLLACNICNVTKADKFPLDDNGKPLLLNPRVDDFAEHISI